MTADGGMDFGFAASIHEPLDWDGRETFELISRLCKAADDYGFDSIWKGQHFLSDLLNFQPIPLLARLSGERPDMHLGNFLLLSRHHPVKAAEYAANLDILTDGNYTCGVVLGYRDVEFDSLDIPKSERVPRMVEAIEAMRTLWTEDPATYHGEHFSFEGVSLNPKPVQEGGPPIWIGANTDAAIRRAAQLGDTWFINPHATMETIESQIDVFEDELDRQGRDRDDVTLPLYREALLAEDVETAVRTAAPHLGEKYAKYVDWGQSDAMGESGSLEGEFDDLLEDRFILGTPEMAREQIEYYRDELGVDSLVVRMYWPDMDEEACLKSVRLFGDEVIPHFR
jgi:alkanesulfonate monooxygenase SsuD/methylene tetrahydromethanopterin reductase-like flavin-dependent oxidoreductase (luciferase family)